jgi:hypothetical protein
VTFLQDYLIAALCFRQLAAFAAQPIGYRLKGSFQMRPAELPPSLRQPVVGVVAICDHNRFGSFADHLLGLRCPATRPHAKDRHRMRCQKP